MDIHWRGINYKVGVVDDGIGCDASIGARRKNAKRCRGGVIVHRRIIAINNIRTSINKHVFCILYLFELYRIMNRYKI